MFWVDKIVEQIIKSGKYRPYHVDDMKTPSGHVHVGSLRGVIIHDLIYKGIIERGEKAVYTYVFNDMDPMDGFPHYLPEIFREHMGKPLFQIPSPEPGYPSFARCYGEEFIRTFNRLGSSPAIIWSSEWYQQGKFNKVIKESLDQVKKIRYLYKKISRYDKPGNWYPFQVICQKCGKVGTTLVTGWDGEKVTYRCQADLVKWAAGCGHEGKVSPFNGTGKLMWKVDWAAHWKVIGITIEGAGKDHMTEGGSHDLSGAICEQALKYPAPLAFLYEWFLARGGAKMSSSKGIGTSAREFSETIPPELLRFLLVRTNYQKAIIIDPNNNDSLLDLFDEYDRFAESYYSGESKDDMAKAWEQSQINSIPKTKPFYPRFRDVVNFVQNPAIDIKEQVVKQKGKSLTTEDTTVLDERIKYAKIWLKNYAPKEAVFQVSAKVPAEAVGLTAPQKSYLKEAAKLLDSQDWQPEQLQQALYELSKKHNIPAKAAFQAIYVALLGKTHGPKAGWLLLDQEKDFAVRRLEEVAVFKSRIVKKRDKFPNLTVPQILSIDNALKSKYPNLISGMAIIKNVRIMKTTPAFDIFKQKALSNKSTISLSDIDNSIKIQSYRKAIRQSGIDWHSRRPTMEALLRRIALGKELFFINTAVDLANLLAIKHHMSEGFFDLDHLETPIMMREANGGEELVLIGDTEKTILKKGEICYFDKKGPFIVDLCYRDIVRTAVTEKTKNVLILTEGVYDITREMVEEMLNEMIKTTLRYCGGKVELAGIVK